MEPRVRSKQVAVDSETRVIMFPSYIMEMESENGEHPSPKRFRYRFVLGVAS